MNVYQMMYLIQNLEKIHNNNAFILNKLNVAKDLLKPRLTVNKLRTLIEVVSAIFHLPDMGENVEKKHAILIKETQDVANIVYAKLSLVAMEHNYFSFGRKYRDFGDKN